MGTVKALAFKLLLHSRRDKNGNNINLISAGKCCLGPVQPVKSEIPVHVNYIGKSDFVKFFGSAQHISEE